MKTYGGFIGLGPFRDQRVPIHPDGCLRSSGRSCIASILDALGEVRRAHIPYYTCDSALLAFRERSINIVFHGIGQDLLPQLPTDIQEHEVLVVNDLFGLLGGAIERATEQVHAHIIHDDTHAFHVGRRSDRAWSFNSARKFLGVPDGAFLFAPRECMPPAERNMRISTDHLVLKSIGAHEEAYKSYKLNEERMSTAPERASVASEEMLARTDLTKCAERRVANFGALKARLGHLNRLDVTANGCIPYCYPFWPVLKSQVERRQFHAAGIFIPTLWQDVINRPDLDDAFGFEKQLSKELLPLPIDQRYSESDMDDLADRMLAILNEA